MSVSSICAAQPRSRAGDVGRGYDAFPQEVKTLATQTAKAAISLRASCPDLDDGDAEFLGGSGGRNRLL